MTANLKAFLKRFCVDAIMGLIASLFVKIIIGMLPSLMASLLPPLIYNGEQWQNIVNTFGYWQIFSIIFGLRFVIAYITGNYSYNPGQAMLDKMMKKVG